MANKKDKIEIYASRKVKGQYGWRYITANGRKVAIAGELYTKYEHTVKMVNKLFPNTPVVDTTKPAKPAGFKTGDRVVLTDGEWKGRKGTVLSRSTNDNYRLRLDNPLGYEGTWSASSLKLAPAKAKRITKAINNPVKP